MAVGFDQFVKSLEDSGIITPSKLQAVRELIPSEKQLDPQELAKELVRQQKLTKYQAQEAYQGKAKNLVLGNYVILDKIGAGGMGQVFKAQHRRMDRIVAVKMLPSAVTKDAAAVARFEREVKAAAKLRHPNIVAADDADQARGIHFLVMEYVEGSDLSALVKKNGPLAMAKALDYVLQAAKGLEYAHKKGVVHRDIKPANLLLDKEGTVKILDMGLARIDADGNAATQAELTGTGAVMGTVDYMAPEQARSTHHADARADIYSLGCSLYYLLTARPLYGGDTITNKLIAHQFDPIPSLLEACEGIPEAIEAVYEKMVAKKVEDRYQSMTEVIADLQPLTTSGSTMLSGTAGATQGESSNSNLTFLKDAAGQTSQRKATKPTKPIKQPKPAGLGGSKNKKLALIGAALLGVLIVAGIIASLRTKDGTLIVEVDQPDAMVQVLDVEGKVEVSHKGGVGKVTISVDPGKHRLRVEKNGFVVFGQEFEIESGGEKAITAKLIHAANWPNDAVEFGLKRFKLYTEHLDWYAAKKKCAELKGRLAEVRTAEENDFLVNLGRGHGVDGIWLGATDEVQEGRWVRSDGSPLNYLNWDDGQPNDVGLNGEDYLMMLLKLKTGKWWDQPTEGGRGLGNDWKMGYVCEWDDPSKAATTQPTQPWNSPEFQAWIKEVQAMPAEEQIKAVSKKLVELNPGFNGKLHGGDALFTTEETPRIENGVVTQLRINSQQITNLYPLQGLVGLKALTFHGTRYDLKSKLHDLSPLRQMQSLKAVNIGDTQVADLTPLEGLSLESLILMGNQVSDLTPLANIKSLKLFWIGYQPVSSIAALKGLPLESVNFGATKITDLEVFRGSTTLTHVLINETTVADLSPLETCPNLKSLIAYKSQVTPASVAALQKALPKCTIEWDDPAKATTSTPPSQLNTPASWTYRKVAEWVIQHGGALWIGSNKNISKLEEIPAGDLTKIDLVRFDETQSIGDAEAAVMSQWPTLNLSLTNTRITDMGLRQLVKVVGSGSFGVAGETISGEGFDAFAGKALGTLVLPGSKLSAQGWKAVARVGPTAHWWLTQSNIDDDALAEIVRLHPEIQELHANVTQLTDRSTGELSSLKNLKTLNLSRTKVTPAGVSALQKALPNCKIDWDDQTKATTPQPAAPGAK